MSEIVIRFALPDQLFVPVLGLGDCFDEVIERNDPQYAAPYLRGIFEPEGGKA